MKFHTCPILLFIHLQLVNTQLIKSNDIYKNVIIGIYRHYECQSVILFHSDTNFAIIQDIEVSTKLRDLLIFFKKHLVKALVTDVNTFIAQNATANHHIVNNLFVFLDDSDKLKDQLVTQFIPSVAIYIPIWLIFFKDETRIATFFENFYIPFDCRFMISQRNVTNDKTSEIITEIYQIDSHGELRQNIFGNWNPETGMKLPAVSLYKRRNNLHGHVFRATALNSPPGSIVVIDKDKNIKLGGFFGDFMELLQESINFTVTYTIANSYGIRMDNGSWTGGMNTLVNNRSDLFPTDLRFVTERLSVIQYSAPIFMINDCFIFRKPPTTVTWNIFFHPFHLNIWLAIICTIFISSLLINLIQLFHRKKYFRIMTDQGPFTNLEVFLDVLGAFCNEAMTRSKIESIAIVQYTIHLTVVVIYAAYSGVLISSLTVNRFEAPIQTLEEFAKDSSYRMGVLDDSAYYYIFRNATDKVVHQIYEHKIKVETSLPQTFAEGIRRVCNEDNYAFLSAQPLISQWKSPNCILKSSETIFAASICMGMHKSSPFRGLINSYIYTFRDNGLLNKISDAWMVLKPNKEEPITPVQLHNVVPLIVFLLGSCLLSLLFLWCERIVHNHKEKIKLRRRRLLKIKRSKRIRFKRKFPHFNLCI